jgi:hypothetical protein
MSAPAPVILTQTWAVYLDFEEAWQWIQMDTAPTGQNRSKLQRMINSACATAQRGANRPFGPSFFRERHDGWSGEYIQLRYSPFLELVACTEWQSTVGPVNLVESTPGNAVEGVQIDYGTSQIMRVFAGGAGSWPRPFFPGSRNIEVSYRAGFNPVPDDVWEATCDLVAYRWRMSQESPRWFPGSGDEYGGGQSSALYPGVPNRIAEVFESYRTPGVY